MDIEAKQEYSTSCKPVQDEGASADLEQPVDNEPSFIAPLASVKEEADLDSVKDEKPLVSSGSGGRGEETTNNVEEEAANADLAPKQLAGQPSFVAPLACAMKKLDLESKKAEKPRVTSNGETSQDPPHTNSLLTANSSSPYTARRRYTCAHCGKTFKCFEHIKKHIRVHVGEPSSCSHCLAGLPRSHVHDFNT